MVRTEYAGYLRDVRRMIVIKLIRVYLFKRWPLVERNWVYIYLGNMSYSPNCLKPNNHFNICMTKNCYFFHKKKWE